MNYKRIFGPLLALVMIASVFVPVVSADEHAGIGLDATILAPPPEIAITVDTPNIGFGELSPGETSASHPVNVTNVGTAEIDVTAVASDAEGQEAIFVPGLLINGAAWSEYSATLVADAEDEFAVALHVPETVTTTGPIGGSLIVYAEEHAAETTVLYDDTVELTAGDTFGFTSSNGTVYTDLNVATDMGALYATGLDLEVSGEWYELYGTFFLESIDGIANEPWPGYSWALYINGTYADVGLYGNPVVTGSNVKLYYLVYDDNFNPLIDEALYLVNIDVAVSYVSPVATFTASPLSGEAPLTVQFTDGSVGAASWSWDFGDGTAALEYTEYRATVEHTYNAAGSFTVTLTVTNAGGSDDEVDRIVVTEAIPAPADHFTCEVVDGTITIKKYVGPGGNVIIPSAIGGKPVTTIGPSAFSSSSLTSIVIPDSVTSIGDSAFSQCKGLLSAIIPDSVTSIGNKAFAYDNSLANVAIGKSVKTIGQNVFTECYALKSITIPDSVTSIGKNAFSSCTALTSILIPDSVTSIGNSVFQGCSALRSVTIGNGVTSIPMVAFSGCNSLTEIIFGKNVTSLSFNIIEYEGITTLTSMVFYGNVPSGADSTYIKNCKNLVIYYVEGASGFTNPWQGRPCYPAVAPTAEFSSDIVSGPAPLIVWFTDGSVGATSWLWNFGDGNTSEDRNPSHEYVVPGTYTVTLTVGNRFGTDTATKTGYVTVTAPAAPAADFSADPTWGYLPDFLVVFSDRSTNSPASWSWDFGDGTKSTEQSPTHYYNSAGIFTVSLTVTNAGGSNTKTVTDLITVEAPLPETGFLAQISGLTVKFRDTTGNMEGFEPTEWEWDFGDGTTLSYTEAQRDTVHTYAAAGTYHVTLTATNVYGTGTYDADVTVA